ncbi:hypothetical protein ACFOY2_02955 [Nonomuraea purpurea]|uniref:Rpn family recombination-promoting nuclease/putative transposase n=1 Tax=Nonomuraea purpurea TaxID=1849276 RepID=A0ABV8FZN4_9ACTN
MFTDQPRLVVEILRDLMGVELPNTPLIQIEERTFNTRTSDDIESDLVFSLGPPQSPAHAVIVEIQQDKSKDPRQLARYAAALWLMLRCDVTVLVVCPDQATATHYAKPIDSGLTGYRLQAQVLGPADIPAITDPQEAAGDLGLAVMSVMVHGLDRKVIETFHAALQGVPAEEAAKYYELAYSASAPAARLLLEEIMASTTWLVHSPFAREHFGRGREEGRAEGAAAGAARMLLRMLAARGLDVPDDARSRIAACTDLAQLEAWGDRAATARTIEDLFDEPAGADTQGTP